MISELGKSVGVVAAALIVTTGPVVAQEPDLFRVRAGQDLVDVCARAGDDAAQASAFCYGFIVGAGSLYRTAVAADAVPRLVCPPAGVDVRLQDIREAFLSWADEHPDKLTNPAADALLEASARRWPCR